MAINSKLKCLILTAMFLSGLSVLHAQSAGYFLDPNSKEPRFIQRLAWSGGAYSLHHEIIIQKEEDGKYVNYMNKFTTDNYFDISLPPGNYRFRVIPYDILDKPGTGTQWAPFKVFNAVRPELYRLEEKADSIDDKQGIKFEFNGKNLEPNAQVYFVNSKGEHIVPVEIIRNDDGSSVGLVFDKEQLTDGKYDVFVINPGGLETSLSGINFESSQKSLGQFFYIAGISFMPAFPLYGDAMGSGGFLLNISARISVNTCMFLSNYLGLELSFSGFSKFWNDDDVQIGFMTGLNLLFTNWLPNRKVACNFRAGAGVTVPSMDFSYLNTGVSFLFRIIQYLNIEAGINYSHSFLENTGGDIMPWIGLSILF